MFCRIENREDVIERNVYRSKLCTDNPVSYTHLDVYKRQLSARTPSGRTDIPQTGCRAWWKY